MRLAKVNINTHLLPNHRERILPKKRLTQKRFYLLLCNPYVSYLSALLKYDKRHQVDKH